MALKTANYLGVSLESLLEIEELKTEKKHLSEEARKIAMDYATLSSRDKELVHCLIQKMKE